MRLLVVSEGLHELEAALPTLVRRLIDLPCEMETEPVRSRKVRVHLRPGRGREYEKRLLGWILYAEGRGYDGVVIVVDEDGRAERLEGARRAQATDRLPLPRAIGIAIRTFDAWMIADERAWREVLEIDIDRCGNPETIRDPKSVARRRLDESGSGVRLRDAYRRLAGRVDLDRISSRCPRGSRPFADRVRQLRDSAARS